MLFSENQPCRPVGDEYLPFDWCSVNGRIASTLKLAFPEGSTKWRVCVLCGGIMNDETFDLKKMPNEVINWSPRYGDLKTLFAKFRTLGESRYFRTVDKIQTLTSRKETRALGFLSV